MSKRLTLLVLVVLAMLVAASPALAAGPSNQNRHENQDRNRTGNQPENAPGRQGPPEKPPSSQGFALTGVITALGSDTITVLVSNGNRTAKPYIGQKVVVQVTENTRYRVYPPEGCVPIGFGDLQVGDTASVQGTVSDGNLGALRVTVDVPCCTP